MVITRQQKRNVVDTFKQTDLYAYDKTHNLSKISINKKWIDNPTSLEHTKCIVIVNFPSQIQRKIDNK